MAYFQNYSRYGNESHTSNTGSLSLRPTLSPSFSLPGITTPNLGIRPETLIIVGGGILLLAYLSKRNEGLSQLGTSTTGAVTNVADALGNTAGLVANVSGKANDGINALFDIGRGIGKASADGWTSVSKTIGKVSSVGSGSSSVGVQSLKTTVPVPVAASGLLINQVKSSSKTAGSSVGSVISSLSPVSAGLQVGAKVGSVVGKILTKK